MPTTSLPVQSSFLVKLGELLVQDAQPVANPPAVGLQLLLTWPPGSDPAPESGEPAGTGEPGQQVLQLGDLDLDPARA